MNQYVLLAKSAAENYVKENKIISVPDDLPQDFLNRKAGVFVTVMKNNRLRACIGTYLPTRPNIAEEIIRNTISAVTQDYRFGEVKEEELFHLSYAVYILGEPELIKNTEELNPKKFGIIVKTFPFVYPDKDVVFDGKTPFKSGLLLPDLEGIDTAEKQIFLACQKGGINRAEEKLFIYRFTVEKYE